MSNSTVSKQDETVPKRSEIKNATILGGGAFGTAMAQVLARNGVKVIMWVLEKEVCVDINTNHKNDLFLKGVNLNKNISATNDFEKSLLKTDFILIVIPTPYLRKVVCEKQTYLPINVPILCCTKGIENDTLLTPFEILVDELPGKYHDFLAALSGPSFAIEVAKGIPTSVLVAANKLYVAQQIQLCMSDLDFRVFTGTDIIGAEICGAVKNVIAIACGLSQGLNLGHNTLTMLITRGLAEITRLAIRKGAHPSTMSGLAGLGDLVLTCTSTQSRNFTVGVRIAKGETMEQINNSMKMVAEGVKTCKSVKRLSELLGVSMPLCDEVYKLVWEGKDIKQSMKDLGSLPLEEEFDPYQHYAEEQMKRNSNASRI